MEVDGRKVERGRHLNHSNIARVRENIFTSKAFKKPCYTTRWLTDTQDETLNITHQRNTDRNHEEIPLTPVTMAKITGDDRCW